MLLGEIENHSASSNKWESHKIFILKKLMNVCWLFYVGTQHILVLRKKFKEEIFSQYFFCCKQFPHSSQKRLAELCNNKRPWKTSSFPMKLKQNWLKWVNWWTFFMSHKIMWNRSKAVLLFIIYWHLFLCTTFTSTFRGQNMELLSCKERNFQLWLVDFHVQKVSSNLSKWFLHTPWTTIWCQT